MNVNTHERFVAGARIRALALALFLLSPVCCSRATASGPAWVSGNRYRILLNVQSRRAPRSNSPASVAIDFASALRASGAAGEFDPDTVEVVAYDASGNPRIFDDSRPAAERYLLPFRVDTDYRMTSSTLNFVLPDHVSTQYAVYFDTRDSGRGRPDRYPGLIGDGDRFTEGYCRREINASGYDSWSDIDGDGDLDILKSSVEPYIYVYENVGANRYVARGRLTSGGQPLLLPYGGGNRSWNSVSLFDWDRDGDQDLFVYALTGPDEFHLMRYENVGSPGAPRFLNRGALVPPGSDKMRSNVRFADYDGDGNTDLLAGRDNMVVFYKNTGGHGSISDMQIAAGAYVKANGVEIDVMSAQVDCADIDADGDLDLFVGTEEGRIFWFENVGTRTAPVFTMGKIIIFHEFMDLRAGVKVADFDGDGLLDVIPGRFWERIQWGEQPRFYGRLYKNVGTPTAPRFEPRDAHGGAPYTERFQIADVCRQNGVRACDWNNDGRTDLIVGDSDGWVWYFRNTTGHKFPIFDPGKKILAGGKPIRVYGEWGDASPQGNKNECRAAGYARCETADWNNDQRKDLLVADGRGWVWVYRNTGTDSTDPTDPIPLLSEGTRVENTGPMGQHPIDIRARGSILVCDFNNDQVNDLILGMAGHNEISDYVDWTPYTTTNYPDSGFLYYLTTGLDAQNEPQLSAPKWIQVDGQNINYQRSNLGAFVDWDGDGKKDFIGCDFEHKAYVHYNRGTLPDGTPEFKASDVEVIVEPWTVQLMSGADAFDFNHDGDLDILTGQGHGASGLRFYERDYIIDFMNKAKGLDTSPVVTPGIPESRMARADFDADGDVDMDDFGRFQECISGTGRPLSPTCIASDFDNDDDADDIDLQHFKQCLAGPNRPPGC